MKSEKEPILFFDADCLFCNSSVQLILKNERKNEILFCALNTDFAKNKLESYFKAEKIPDSLIYLYDNKIYIKSNAALMLAKKLKGLYPLLLIFIIVPKALRDLFYDLIAKNRYKWFGKATNCIIPDKNRLHRFIL